MAAHSSIPTWRIPWTEEPGGLLSMGPQSVGQDLAVAAAASEQHTSPSASSSTSNQHQCFMNCNS